MPANTLDLFVEERLQVINLPNVHCCNTGSVIDVGPILLDDFTETEFRRINILLEAEFIIEIEELPNSDERNRNRHIIGHLCWEGALARRNINYKLIEKFLRVLYKKNIIFNATETGFILFEDCLSDGQLYVLLYNEETWANTNISVCSHVDDCIYMIVNSHEDAGFSCSDEQIHCDGEYYINSEVASDLGIYYRDCCDEYFHEDVGFCCERGDSQGSQGETFDNTFKQVYSKPKFINFTRTSGMNYTFGVELETCVSGSVPNNESINMKSVYDGSTDGLEYVSGVMHGNKGVENIEKMCYHLNNYDAAIDRKCGVHIHIGGAVFNRRFSIMVARLSKELENDLYSMLPPSRQDNTYCKRLPSYVSELNFRNYRKKLGELLMNTAIDRDHNKKKNHPNGHYNSQRYYWLNMTNYSCSSGPDTIEFRCHGGTLDFTKIYNWLLICMSIVKFAENQQRRIWNCGLSDKNKITLKEVLKYSLTSKDYKEIWPYIQKRVKQFSSKL